MKRNKLLTMDKVATGFECWSPAKKTAEKTTFHLVLWATVLTGFLFLGSCKTCQCPAYSSVPPSVTGITAQNGNVTPELPAFIIRSAH